MHVFLTAAECYIFRVENFCTTIGNIINIHLSQLTICEVSKDLFENTVEFRLIRSDVDLIEETVLQ